METREGRPALVVYESVRCLECARIYSKPVGGGTVWANPGCPHCGYVGWISVAIPFAESVERRRFGRRRVARA